MNEQQKHDSNTYLDADQVTLWLEQWGKPVLFTLLAIVALSLLGYRYSLSKTSHAEADYFKAENDYQVIQSLTGEKENLDDAFRDLEAIIAKHPELNAKYDGLLAQAYLNEGKNEQAIPYAEQNLKRIKVNNVSNYLEFSNTTLLIAQKDYNSALNKSLKLQDQIKDEALLKFINLLRIAELYQMNGQTADAKATYQKILDQYGESEFAKNYFESGKTNFKEFIKNSMK